LSAALKKNLLSEDGYAQMIAHTTRLNTPGLKLSDMSGVHALTDVTGFGLAGHLLEICRGSSLSAEVRFDDLPLIADAVSFAQDGISTGASTRNWTSYGKDVVIPSAWPQWRQTLVTDPQTSGGLLVACAPDTAAEVLALFQSEGFAEAKIIGELKDGPAQVTVI
jgi:selenide,water dikinase